MSSFSWLEDITDEEWDRARRGEVDLVFYLTRAAWPHLKASRGVVVNMASLNASLSFKILPSLAHTTNKAGIIGMTRQLAMEGREHGIRANSISPGLIESNATRDQLEDPEWASAMLGKTLLGRLGRPEEVANVARVPGLGRELLRDGSRHRRRRRDEGLVTAPAPIGLGSRRDRGGQLRSSQGSRVSVKSTANVGDGAWGLIDREDLLQMLDRAVTRRVTVISAPPGSGKTSLLRAWADRSTNLRRVAFVSVDRDQQNAKRFWCAVLDAIRSPARSIDPETQPAAIAVLDGDQVVDRVLSEVAERVEPVVLIIDDLHELRSADAITQLERLLASLPSSARVVLSSRRDPPIRLHQLRLAGEIAEIRAGDLRVH